MSGLTGRKQNTGRHGFSRFAALMPCLFLAASLVVFPALAQKGAAVTYQELELACPAAESGEHFAHMHNSDCYKNGSLVCPLPEIEEHTHTEECFETVRETICGLEESKGHVHSDSCYALTEELSCGLEESEGHTHTDACWLWVTDYICGQNDDPDHIHDESCLGSVKGELICGQEEHEGHTHTEACFARETVPSCGMEEGAGAHTHDESCYAERKVCVCGCEELPVHIHGAGCFRIATAAIQESPAPGEEDGEDDAEEKEAGEEQEEDSAIVTEESFDWQLAGDPDADTESEYDWQKMFVGLKLTGKWDEDLLLVAETQIGYRESTLNYAVTESGSIKGYTRYGAWYGLPYGDWCAMFASFCIRYAGIPEAAMPIQCNCGNWVRALSDLGMFRRADEYTPKKGDLVFYDPDGDGISNHVGIVASVDPEAGTIGTIEGNRTDTVEHFVIKAAEGSIAGYGILPENMETPAADTALDESVWHFESSTEGLDIAVDAPREAFSEEPHMFVNAAAAGLSANGSGESTDDGITEMHAVEISFRDADGNEILPQKPVKLTITPRQTDAFSDSSAFRQDGADTAADTGRINRSAVVETALEAENVFVYAVDGRNKSLILERSTAREPEIPQDRDFCTPAASLLAKGRLSFLAGTSSTGNGNTDLPPDAVMVPGYITIPLAWLAMLLLCGTAKAAVSCRRKPGIMNRGLEENTEEAFFAQVAKAEERD